MTIRSAPIGAASRVALATLLVALAACRVPRPGGAADGSAAAVDGGSTDAAVTARDAAPPADDALPSGEGSELEARAKHLLEAIARDDTELAADIEFPRDAWAATRDCADPTKDWEKHVAGPFRRSVHGLSRRYRDMGGAQLVSFALGHAMQQQTPHRHAWTKPLWTIRGSKLTFTVDGKVRTITVREMVAWRGAWYVTRLR